jgi:hypothetical protein
MRQRCLPILWASVTFHFEATGGYPRTRRCAPWSALQFGGRCLSLGVLGFGDVGVVFDVEA